jgi:hypothetical protein
MRMPRASNSAKRHQAASNQRDTRHENGLVGPGKRVIKRKSQTQLDDGSKLAVDSASVPPLPPLPSTLNGFATHLDDMAPEHRAAELLRRGSLGTYSESSSTDSLPAASTHDVSEATHRRIDVNDAKNTNVHRDPGPLDLAITVLRSCPLADTIAILIILMQASPAVLATIYMLFTVLTFVPPVTTSSGLSITEIFDGSQGIPSLWTLIWMDVIMLLIWLFLWAPVQQFILDLAQVVISYTLGGGGTSRQGTTPGIVLCVGIVGVTHWIQKWNGLSRFTTIFGSARLLSSDAAPSLRMFDKKVRVAYLYRPDVIELYKPNIGRGGEANEVLESADGPVLKYNPGRIDPSNSAFSNSRKPLIAQWKTVRGTGKTFFTVNVHFSSKGGSAPIHGDPRPPLNGAIDSRQAQAEITGDFIGQIMELDPEARIVAAGDFNEFTQVQPMQTFLKRSGLIDLEEAVDLDPTERYTYLFDMNCQSLDHVFISPSLGRGALYEHLHLNTWQNFDDQVSDHDPSVARFNMCGCASRK